MKQVHISQLKTGDKVFLTSEEYAPREVVVVNDAVVLLQGLGETRSITREGDKWAEELVFYLRVSPHIDERQYYDEGYWGKQ